MFVIHLNVVAKMSQLEGIKNHLVHGAFSGHKHDPKKLLNKRPVTHTSGKRTDSLSVSNRLLGGCNS